LNGSDFQVLQLQVGPTSSNPVVSIPTSLTTHTPYPVAQAAVTRNLLFQAAQMGPTGMVNGPFRINGVSYDSSVINYRIPIDQIEIWELQNMTAIAHPFHIHDVQFYILDINGVAPPANMQGRKDVVLVPPMQGTVRFITKFDDFANDKVPYMYHCHMLSHEDEGMMGQFVVFDNTIAIEDQEDISILVYPNPVYDDLVIDGLESSTIELFNTTGQLLFRKETLASKEHIWVKAYAPGVYYLKVKTRNNLMVYKVLKK
jgi:bilirubin oxidase